MAFIRLWKWAVRMTLREKKMFVIFSLIYTILIFLTSFFLEVTFSQEGAGGLTTYFVIIFFGTSLFLSVLYAWLIVVRNRRVWATLKAIGYTNGNINSLVTGIILYTTVMGFIIVVEALLHYAAIITYLHSANILRNLPVILISLLPVAITFGVFLIVQLIAILIANRKVLKVRPMLALKRVGE
ncbi:MAG: FtsX-like permease family protein [Candidatus Lokiarchaeota archaeon]|nr:FtsX-like permease family protein [Candidatus Lokiarchaeota archaeon]MBD3339698.1 FtsX-like permease family protein [Candidatus Lokiarchaeota archaeon]